MEKMGNYMYEEDGFKAEFEAICNRYGYSEEEKDYEALLDLYIDKRKGNAYTMYESLSNFSALEMAKMLKQLLGVGKGGFILQNVGGLESNTFTDVSLLWVLKRSLEDALQERVKKITDYKRVDGTICPALLVRKDGIIDWLHYEYPEGCSPQDNGFSEVELDMIIEGEEEVKERLKRELMGNKEKWEDGYTRLPDLGEQALMLLDSLPQEWTTRKKHCFIADYMFNAGFLDFKSEQWKAKFERMQDREKDRMVRNWINADLAID